MQKFAPHSHCFFSSICRQTTVTSSAATIIHHFRLFSSKLTDRYESVQSPQRAEQSEIKAKKEEPSTGVDPFGWEPTKWDRFFLVLTRCYASRADIPAVVSSRIGRKFAQRMRILRYLSSLIVGIIVFFGLEFYLLSWEKHVRSGQLREEDMDFVKRVSDASRIK